MIRNGDRMIPVPNMKQEYDSIMGVVKQNIDDSVIHNTMSVLIGAGEDIAMKMKVYHELERESKKMLTK